MTYFPAVFRSGVTRGRFVFIFFSLSMASDEWDVSYVNTKHFKRPGVYLSKMTLFPKAGTDS